MNTVKQLHITYYTDPLCCWSWAMEPAWQQLLQTWRGRVSWRYCMGGLLRDWKSYRDDEQHVSRPIQMGPVWLDAKYISGQPFNEKIWISDPPASSYPACMAVKCAALQGPEAEHFYLHALRRAVMQQGINIARKENLLAVAATLADTLDVKLFEAHLDDTRSLEAFRADLQEVSYRDISRLPSMVMQRPGEKTGGVFIKGYRLYDVLHKLAEQVVQGSEKPTAV